MNNWKEQAYLFTNGQFEVRWDHHNADYVEDVNLGKENWMINTPKVIENCTLIARTISDMGDDEKAKWKSFIYENSGNMIKRYAEQTAYLLSISVYPFDQDDFETGQVLNINEV